jgi:hypothetical protein
MTAQQDRVAFQRLPTVTLPREVLTEHRDDVPEEPAWLLESLRHEFWDPSELARGAGPTDPIAGEQQPAIAQWWSTLRALESVGPPSYAAMFASACERHDSDQVRLSLLAMLRDAVKHEQVCRIAHRRVMPEQSGQEGWTDLARGTDQHLRQVEREAGRCWREWQRALHRHGIGVVSGAMLLRSLTLGGLYEQWSYTCAVPAVTAMLRNMARDHQRHQCVLRALADQSCRTLSSGQRATATSQVQGTARLLSVALLDPEVGPRIGADALPGHIREPGLGVPVAQRRLELLRTALLEVRDLHARHGIPFHAMPELAIPAARRAEGPTGA